MERTPLRQRIRGGLPVLAVAAVTLIAVYGSVTILAGMPYDPSPTPQNTSSDQALGTDELPPTDMPEGSFDESPTPYVEPTVAITALLPSTPPTVIAMTASAKDPKGVWSASLRYPKFRPETTPLAETMNDDLQGETEDRIQRFSVGPADV